MAKCFVPVELRHGVIEEHEPNVAGGIGKHGETFDAGRRIEDIVTVLAQHGTHQMQERRIVIDDQNCELVMTDRFVWRFIIHPEGGCSVGVHHSFNK